MYSSSILVLFGCVGNILALFVFISAKHRPPKVNGSSYMIALTVTNTLYMIVHWYNGALNRIVYHFNLQNANNFFNLINHLDTMLV
jgi:hypothetical protein